MLTQEQALAELRQLNQELGLPEDDGAPMTQAQAEAELRALDEELASTPESFGEYVERRKVEDSRSLGDKTSAFTDSFLTGAGALASEGSKAIGELFSGNVGKSEIGGVFKIGMADFGRFAETLGGAAMDNFYSDEEEMKREYERYKDNFLYNQNVRTAMLNTYDEKGRDFISFGANFVDPTLLIPVAGLLTKGASLGAKAVAIGAKAGAFAARSPRLVQLSKAMAKTSRGAQKVAKGLDKVSDVASIPAKLAASGTRKAIKGSALVGSKIAGGVGRTGESVSKVAALPRTAVTGFASKFIDPKIAGSGILGAQATGALTGAVPGLGLLTGAEALGYIANKTGRGVERTLSALSSTGGQKRFLQRLATSADSPRLRKLALMAHAGGATKLTDLAFNSLVNGASVGALNGALAYAAGEGAEGVGAAVGSGTLMGGSLPFGQPGMKGGKSQAARDQSSINFLNAKLADDQIKQFQKLSPDARLAFATVEEAGIRAPKLAFLDKQTYLDFLRQDDPNLRQAPNAHYDMGDNTIYVNQDGNAGRSSKEAMDILTHELGHHFITQGIKDDPLFARKILEQYEAKPGEESFEFAFTTDSAGSPIDSIQLNADAKKISDGYDSIQSGDQSISVGMDANKLAQEIGAEQFAMMMVDNPNIFNTIEPSLRQKLLDGSRKVLTMFGAVDGNTGNPLDISISPILKRNKQVRNLYKNYIKQREKSIADKVDLAEKGVSIKVRKGESADQAVERMFGAQGISLKDSGAFRINNKKVKEKLSQILNRLDEQPEGPMSSERNPKSGKPQSIVGKELSPELKNVFTRNDPRGTINVLINDITESIKNRIQLNFLYRSGKPSKYSDNELKGRVVSPVRFKVTGLSKGSRSAASLKMDAIDEAYLRNNVEVLVKEGFAKDPNKLIEQAREVARQAMDDPEGRINPEGNFENELITAVFGMEQSAPQIRNAKLRQLLEDKKLQHAYRSYDVDALAGLVPTGKSGIAFDYFNIKNNYSPFDDKLFMPTEIQEGSPGSFFRPKSSRDKSAKLRTFKSPVYLKDGSRLSGVADNPEQNPFYGFDKNGQEFSQRREYVNPQDITKSRDSDRTANQIRNELESGQKLFMPASEAGAGKGKLPKSGDMLTLDDKSLKLFLPSPGNPNASLSDFKGKNVQVLTSDLSVVGNKKADGVDVAFTGGPGYLSVNDAWGFTNEGSAKSFKTRWERDGKPLIGITSMKQDNHKASSLTREYYVRKFMQAINEGKISENTVNRHIKAALKRAIKGKGLTDNQKAALKTVKTIQDFLRVFPDKELIPWKATPIIYDKLNIKKDLPITQVRLKKLGLDTDTILRETRQPEYNDIQKGSLLAIAEYDGTDAVYRPDLNTAYPWSIPLKEKAFLKEFADIQDLSSRQDLRGSDGEANIGVAMGAGVMLDKLGRGDVNFMPSDPKAPKAQPANRITRQAPAMPGNRFMAPAVSAGAKSAERFR